MGGDTPPKNPPGSAASFAAKQDAGRNERQKSVFLREVTKTRLDHARTLTAKTERLFADLISLTRR